MTAPAYAWNLEEVPVVPLPGKTTLSGTHAGFVRVQLLQPYRVLEHGDIDEMFTPQAGARASGVALVSEKKYGLATPSAFWLEACVSDCTHRYRTWHAEAESSDFELPAGVYRLYLMGEAGRQTTVSLNLPGVLGLGSVAPVAAVRFEHAPLTEGRGSGTTRFWTGSGVTEGESILEAVYAFGAPGPGAGLGEACLYTGDAPEAPMYTCPGGSTVQPDLSRVRVTPPLDGVTAGLTATGLPPGPQTLQIRHDDVGTPVNFTGSLDVLTYDQTPGSLPLVALPSSLHVSEAARLRRRDALVTVGCQAAAACSGRARFSGGKSVRFAVQAASEGAVRIPLPRRMSVSPLTAMFKLPTGTARRRISVGSS
jgi:hypothetical protein